MIEERKRYIPPFEDIPSSRAKMAELPIEKRIKDFSEVEFVLGKEVAIAEAARCLSCRRCLGCKLCLAACEPRAISFEEPEESLELTVDALVITPGVERVTGTIRQELGYGRCLNVVDGVEFESILRKDGAYGGLLIRPSDGDVPGALAFICEDEDHEALAYVLKEIMAVRKRFPEIQTTLFSNGDASGLGAGGADIPCRHRRGKVVEIREKENQDLSIHWKGDRAAEEEFQMVVVITPLVLPPETAKLIDQLDLPRPSSFWEQSDTSLVTTGKENVFFAGGIGKVE